MTTPLKDIFKLEPEKDPHPVIVQGLIVNVHVTDEVGLVDFLPIEGDQKNQLLKQTYTGNNWHFILKNDIKLLGLDKENWIEGFQNLKKTKTIVEAWIKPLNGKWVVACFRRIVGRAVEETTLGVAEAGEDVILANYELLFQKIPHVDVMKEVYIFDRNTKQEHFWCYALNPSHGGYGLVIGLTLEQAEEMLVHRRLHRLD